MTGPAGGASSSGGAAENAASQPERGRAAKRPRRRRSRTHQAVRIGVELMGGLIAAAVLVVSVAAWRLSEGPIRTDFLTPYIQAAVNQGGGNQVEIGGTFLVWEEGTRGLVLHAAEVTVRDGENKLVAALPQVAFELSTTAILQGTLALNQVEIIAPRLRLLRAKDGSIAFGREASAPSVSAESIEGAVSTGEDVVLGRMINELLGEREPGNPLSYLDEVRIRDGQIYVRDDLLGLSWAAPSADISLRRDVAGLAGDISLGFTGRRDPATFDAAFLFDKQAGIIDLAAGFSDISLAALAKTFPVLAPVGGLTSRISGSISTSLALDGTVGHTGFDLQGFAGTLQIPGIDMPPLPVRDMTMRGRYDSTQSLFNLHETRVRLGSEAAPGPVFSIGGVFDYDPSDKGWVIDADAALEDVPLADLTTYWPETVAADARPWVVENVTTGSVAKATAAFDVTVPAGDFGAAVVNDLTGTIAYSDVEAYYLRPMPPVRGISGTASYDLDTLRFAIASGQLEGVTLSGSTIEITGLTTARPSQGIHEEIDIRSKATGPLREALVLLEHPRLDLLSKLDLSSEGSEGNVSADVAFQFPLINDLEFEDIALQVKAAVVDTKLKNVVLGQDVTRGRLALNLDQGGMRIAGPLVLGGVPLSMRWQESFSDAATVRSVLEAEIPSVSDKQRARFGLDLGDVLQGPLQASATLVVRRSGASSLLVSADLMRATISLPEIHWNKQEGVDGSLSLTVDLDSTGPLGYRDIVLQAGDLLARGSATPAENRVGLGSVELERVAFGRSSLRNVSLKLEEESIDVSIGGGTLDAEPFVEDDAAESELADEEAGAPRTFEPLSIRAPDLDVLYFAEERRLELVNLELRRSREGWQTIRLSGSIPEQYWSPDEAPAADEQGAAEDDGEVIPAAPVELNRRYLQFSFAPDATGSGQRMLAMSDDLGALLRATNITDTVVGGSIEITGHSEGPSPTYPIHAKVAARDFAMANAPTLAKLLTVASFTGILNLLGGEGIGFAGMDGDFILEDGVATTELMRVYGASLGITARGEIDFNEDAIDLDGVVVPAYSINDFINKIPLLGPLLTGGEGEGLFAVAYSVQGGVDDPEVSVNPLTAFAPGFLRNLFTPQAPRPEGAPIGAAPNFRDRIDK